MIDKIKNIFYKMILILLLIFIAYISYASIFDIYKNDNQLKPIVIIIGTIFMIIGLLCVKKLIYKIDEKKIKIIAIILSILFFIGMSIFGNIYKTEPTYDLNNIITEAYEMLENNGKFDETGYLARCTNQIPLQVIVFLIFKLGTFIGLNGSALLNFATVINSLCIAITAYFVYLSVKEIKSNKFGLIALLFFIINPIFYLYSSYFYTDTLCMPFAAVAMYLLICILKEKHSYKKQIIEIILAGFLLAIGTKIRVVIAILVLAFVLSYMLIKCKLKKKVIFNSIFIISFILGIFILNLFLNQFGTIKNNDDELPISHYLMMGLNLEKSGKWNAEDFNYTLKQTTHEEKVSANIKMINERISEMTVSNYIELIHEKLVLNWTDGDYDIFSKLNNVVEEKNIGYEYIEGNKTKILEYLLQVCKVTLMITFLIATIAELKNNSEYKYIYIAMLGMFVFYLIWEVSSRYSLTCLPWMIILLPFGLEQIEKVLNIKKIILCLGNDKTKTINFEKFFRTGYICIFILSILLLIINFDKYCIQKKKYDDINVAIKRNNSQIEEIYNKEIKQSFITNKPFNQITLSLNKNEKNDINNIYHFVILDDLENEIVNQEFDSEDIIGSQTKTFKFETITPNNEFRKYTIKLYSESKSNDNVELLAFYGGENYDIFKNGELKINDNIQKNKDILLKVENNHKRTYMSKKIYVLLGILVLLIEGAILYYYSKTKVLIPEKTIKDLNEMEKEN